ncbi:hypothetical protein CL633_02090 [bacterium]|nr:hypothetical protein [bacterium]
MNKKMNFLQKLQSKPKKLRKKIMWLATGASMILVILIWLLSFPKSFTAEKKSENQATDQPKLPSFEEIKNNIKDLKQEFQDIEIPEVTDLETINVPKLIDDDYENIIKKELLQLPLE